MKLHEIIALCDEGKTGIELSVLKQYKRSLMTYYSRYYARNNEPIVVVTAVFNACAYGFIASSGDFSEAIDTYLDADPSLSDEDKEAERETIAYNSIPLSKL